MAELAAVMLDRQTDSEEAVRQAWAPAVQPLALHLVWAAAGLGDERLVPPALRCPPLSLACRTAVCKHQTWARLIARFPYMKLVSASYTRSFGVCATVCDAINVSKPVLNATERMRPGASNRRMRWRRAGGARRRSSHPRLCPPPTWTAC